MLTLSATRLDLSGGEVVLQPLGDLLDLVRAQLGGAGKPGLVILGSFGSGKTTLCQQIATDPSAPPCTIVPIRSLAPHASVEEGLRRTLGEVRLGEVRDGLRILLLDGLDEVVQPQGLSIPAFFDTLIAHAGPRWILTSRPGHFRTDGSEALPDQVDAFSRGDVDVIRIDPLPAEVAHTAVASLPGGEALLHSVEGLAELATSPLLLHVVHAALPFIDPGRPIQPWGLFDAWVRRALDSGPGHEDAIASLEDLAWNAFREFGYSTEVPSFARDDVLRLGLPPPLRSLLLTDLDGRLRFGHRSLYEFLVAVRIAPRLRENQERGPDALSGRALSDATRAFLVGHVPAMPVAFESERVRVPRGNFVSGGDLSADERPLRIAHLERPFWIARRPVTHEDWASFLTARPDDRVDVHYLPHWGVERRMPSDLAMAPIYGIWPEDADRFAAWAGARLPTADEWEKAVRGIDGRRWPWGDYWRPWSAVTAETGLEKPLAVHAFGAHGPCALFSAVGGVFEYTASAYRGRPERGRIVMGGCFTHPAATSRAGLRLSHKLSGNLKAGLRLAWDAS